jgi:tRNA A37 methylthiotransferase MiaB
MGYNFFYSERPGTLAARKLADDIPLEVKKRRLQEIIDRQQLHSRARYAAYGRQNAPRAGGRPFQTLGRST